MLTEAHRVEAVAASTTARAPTTAAAPTAPTTFTDVERSCHRLAVLLCIAVLAVMVAKAVVQVVAHRRLVRALGADAGGAWCWQRGALACLSPEAALARLLLEAQGLRGRGGGHAGREADGSLELRVQGERPLEILKSEL